MGELLGAPFGLVPDAVWRTAFARLPIGPIVTGRISYLDAPDEVVGSLITVPLAPSQMLSLPRSKVQAKISAAVDKARDLGARIVGLGALTAPASAGGKSLAKRSDVGITNGNAFTAAMTLMGMEQLLTRVRPDPLIAIVGATGSVGACLTRLFARQHDGRLLLVARNEGRLESLAKEVRRPSVNVATSTDMSTVAGADLVVLLTSAAEALLRSEHLKFGAVVLDDTVPRNTDPRLLVERPDVLVVDGGLIEIPGVNIEGAIGLAPKLAYACLAETMLLALGDHEGHFSIGTPQVEQAEHLLNLAAAHRDLGFSLAPFRSFGKLITEPWARLAPIPTAELASCAA
jgi:predicted amino acid dehydrogenase